MRRAPSYVGDGMGRSGVLPPRRRVGVADAARARSATAASTAACPGRGAPLTPSKSRSELRRRPAATMAERLAALERGWSGGRMTPCDDSGVAGEPALERRGKCCCSRAEERRGSAAAAVAATRLSKLMSTRSTAAPLPPEGRRAGAAAATVVGADTCPTAGCASAPVAAAAAACALVRAMAASLPRLLRLTQAMAATTRSATKIAQPTAMPATAPGESTIAPLEAAAAAGPREGDGVLLWTATGEGASDGGAEAEATVCSGGGERRLSVGGVAAAACPALCGSPLPRRQAQTRLQQQAAARAQ